MRSNKSVGSESSHRRVKQIVLFFETRLCLLVFDNKMSSHAPNIDGRLGKEFGLDISEHDLWFCHMAIYHCVR